MKGIINMKTFYFGINLSRNRSGEIEHREEIIVKAPNSHSAYNYMQDKFTTFMSLEDYELITPSQIPLETFSL